MLRLLRGAGLALFTLYAVAVGALTACQRALIYHPNALAVAPSAAGVSVQHIHTADGETLVAWYLPPPTHNGARGPIFLFFDGNGGRPEFASERWRRLQEGGAGFLAVYYRGYSGSTGQPTEAGLHTDARAGYDWLVTHGYRAQDIVIDGYSLGTGVAVRLAAERPARALVLEAPFLSMSDHIARVAPFAPNFLVEDRFASSDYIRNVHMPVFFAHGDADAVVSFEEGEALYAFANEPKEFVRMPGSTHASLVRDGVYDHVWAFLAQHPG